MFRLFSVEYLLRALRRYQFVSSSKFLLVCIALAFILRMAYILIVQTTPSPIWDSSWYFERAIAIAQGEGYTVDGVATAYWPVGYPGFLGILFALSGPSLFLAKCFNILFAIGTLINSYHLARLLFQSEIQARITAGILVFYPDHIVYTSLLSSELLFQWLLVLAVLVLLLSHTHRSLWWTGVCGVVFGLATLVKPQALIVPAILLSYLFLRMGLEKTQLFRAKVFPIVQGILLYGVLFLTIMPWTIRNALVFGDFVLVSTNGGINLLIGNNPYATGTYVSNKSMWELIGDTSNDSEVEIDQKARTYALSYIKNHPMQTIILFGRKIVFMYGNIVDGFVWNISEVKSDELKHFIIMLYIGTVNFYWLLIVGFLVGTMLVGFRRKTNPFAFVGLLIILYFTGISLLFFGTSRFHFPLIPWFAMYAAISVERLLVAILAFRKRRSQDPHSQVQ